MYSSELGGNNAVEYIDLETNSITTELSKLKAKAPKVIAIHTPIFELQSLRSFLTSTISVEQLLLDDSNYFDLKSNLGGAIPRDLFYHDKPRGNTHNKFITVKRRTGVPVHTIYVVSPDTNDYDKKEHIDNDKAIELVDKRFPSSTQNRLHIIRGAAPQSKGAASREGNIQSKMKETDSERTFILAIHIKALKPEDPGADLAAYARIMKDATRGPNDRLIVVFDPDSYNTKEITKGKDTKTDDFYKPDELLKRIESSPTPTKRQDVGQKQAAPEDLTLVVLCDTGSGNLKASPAIPMSSSGNTHTVNLTDLTNLATNQKGPAYDHVVITGTFDPESTTKDKIRLFLKSIDSIINHNAHLTVDLSLTVTGTSADSSYLDELIPMYMYKKHTGSYRLELLPYGNPRNSILIVSKLDSTRYFISPFLTSFREDTRI